MSYSADDLITLPPGNYKPKKLRYGRESLCFTPRVWWVEDSEGNVIDEPELLTNGVCYGNITSYLQQMTMYFIMPARRYLPKDQREQFGFETVPTYSEEASNV